MGYINFDKEQLVNLEYSLTKEMVRSNRAGAFTCSTILGCNTRKYHGLLICQQPGLSNLPFVLLSKVDETVIQRNAEFNIGVNRFPGTYNPKGHKYVMDFNADLIPMVTYSVGGVVLTKETLFVSHKEMIMIRYTLVQAKSPTRLRIRPYLAFRQLHELSKQNLHINAYYNEIPGGVSFRLYENFTDLNMQLSKEGAEYIPIPDWYLNFEYFKERDRGYDYHEDLFTPGYFEFDIAKGESVVFSASTSKVVPSTIVRIFNSEVKSRIPRNSFENCLLNSAQQFVVKQNEHTELIAGYPWYSRQARFSFIALPGLMYQNSLIEDCKVIIQNMVNEMKGPCFVELPDSNDGNRTTADTSLWFFWALQNLIKAGESPLNVWSQYGTVLKTIIQGYRDSAVKGIHMQPNGMLYISESYPDITWMNARINNRCATPRYGLVVEVNALWYNAVLFAIELAQSTDSNFVETWLPVAENIRNGFAEVFWNEDKKCLFDFVAANQSNAQVRPNQILAASLPYSPLAENHQKLVLDKVTRELLTPRGLRSLSPNDHQYKGRYAGNEHERNLSLHQGTVWPWLSGHYADAYLKIYGAFGLEGIISHYHGFEESLREEGVGTICEIYEGDPPHQGNGAVSFAASVAELLRIKYLIDTLSSQSD
ncbi:MAG TPA: amylo-alpha-1,6-glucosidase [Bacteroidales bacterium]|nr:amylo-alpha-1,6-glucosidase [Bacteroidales bacterium]